MRFAYIIKFCIKISMGIHENNRPWNGHNLGDTTYHGCMCRIITCHSNVTFVLEFTLLLLIHIQLIC